MTFLRLLVALLSLVGLPALAEPVLPKFLAEVPAETLVPEAEAYGPIDATHPVVPVLKDGETIAWAFITTDFVSTTGYSGKPIHTLVAVDKDARIVGLKLVKHSEPIVLIGIPQAKIDAVVQAYVGLDLVAEAQSGGTGHDVDIISGATVTVMVIDDSIVRAGL
ncbi:MAG: FMN-binding protein, partial [Rhodobacterales bacterium]|nr:FMN-binding protein [Rhodobacterales bacterium]